MSAAVKVAVYLLTHNSNLLAAVPLAKISPGVIPGGTTLPAIAISHVSTVRKQMLSAPASEFFASRIQVTVMASSYSNLQAVIELVRAALPRTNGAVDGVAVDSLLHEMDGPDFRDDDVGAYLATIDYVVMFNQ